MLFLASLLVCPRNKPARCFSVKKWRYGFEPIKEVPVSHIVSHTSTPDAVIAFLSSRECEQTVCRCSTNSRVVTLPKTNYTCTARLRMLLTHTHTHFMDSLFSATASSSYLLLNMLSHETGARCGYINSVNGSKTFHLQAVAR